MRHGRAWRNVCAVARLGLALALATAAGPLWAEDPPAAATPPPAEGPPAATPAAPAAATPVAETAPEKTGAGIEVSGFVDTYYSYNLNEPAGGDAQLRNFDTKHNQLSLNLVELAFEQKPTAESRLGFRADIDFGPTTELVHAAEPGGTEIFKSFEQAYLSYLAPAGKGLQIDVGKFVTQHGAEVIETKDNWNYSRSLLFALAIPYYHLGLRASYPVSDKLTVAAFLVNGWNNAVDNNSGKTIGFQALVKPHPKLTLVQNFMGGPEQADLGERRFLSDTILTFNATSVLSLMLNYDYGTDRMAGLDVSWQGLAAYLRLQATSSWAISPRFEWLDDGDGFMTGTSQTVREVTLTSEHKIDGGLLARLEYRRDFSDQEFFLKDGRKVKDQNTFTIGLVYAFGARF